MRGDLGDGAIEVGARAIPQDDDVLVRYELGGDVAAHVDEGRQARRTGGSASVGARTSGDRQQQQ